jgi:hypothetical protein
MHKGFTVCDRFVTKDLRHSAATERLNVRVPRTLGTSVLPKGERCGLIVRDDRVRSPTRLGRRAQPAHPLCSLALSRSSRTGLREAEGGESGASVTREGKLA